jgi:chromosome segregation ATPase
MADMKTEIEQIEKDMEKVEVEEKIERSEKREVKSEIEVIREKIKAGDMKLSEIGAIFSDISKKIEKKMERIAEIDRTIMDYKERISQLEREKQRLREEIRDMNVLIGGIQDMIKSAMGFATVSKISGKPINVNSNRGKGFRVHVKTTESGIKAGLMNVNAEFSSMAKAVYALQPSAEGKRTDFKAKLEKWAKDGLIELQFL